MVESFDIKKNHVYVGNSDKAPEWAGLKQEEPTDEHRNNLIAHIREKIKNYLQLDNVSFLFGTGSSIHLGAVGIQNIPLQVEKDIVSSGDNNLKEDFKKYITALQKPMLDSINPEKDKKFTRIIIEGSPEWDMIYDGSYIRNYEGEDERDEIVDMSKHYGEILLQFELLLNYLTAMLFQKEAEKIGRAHV